MIIIGAAVAISVAARKRRVKRSPCPTLSPGKGNIAGYDYIEFTTGGASLEDRLPIIFFFHSRGSSPESMSKHLDIPSKSRVVMPFGKKGSKSNPRWFDGKASSEDQDSLANEMAMASESVSNFITIASRCLGGTVKPIVAGHSQGGMLALALAARRPGSVKAAVAASAWLPVPLWPSSLPPTKMVHGTGDRAVDYFRSADFAERAKVAGLPIEFYSVSGKHGLSGELKKTWLDLIDSEIQ